MKDKFKENCQGDLLNFKKKQSITVLAYDENKDSFYGSLEGKKGWFPSNLVKVKENETEQLRNNISREGLLKELEPLNHRKGSKSANSKDLHIHLEGSKVQKGVNYNLPLRTMKYINSNGIPLLLESSIQHIKRGG